MAKKTRKSEVKKRTPNSGVKTADYRHTDQKRKNIPPAKIAAEGKVPRVANVRYEYSPHLPPSLRLDPTGRADKVPELVATAGKRALNDSEQKLLAGAVLNQQPWLEWAGKREQHDRGFFDVDPLALHIHERISTQAILRTLAREDVQRDLFADPQQAYAQAVQFYKHDVDWANRIVLGDSLQVMSSLARREDLGGKVQLVYIDPPYGISFKSNFQSQLGERDVRDRDQDLTREPEMVRAYRDTWTLGVHSYLAYLRDRFFAAKELLTNTGSIFVQIGEENVHLVRAVLEEVFGTANFCGQITVNKAASQSSSLLSSVNDFLLWFARDSATVKYRQLFAERPPIDDPTFRYICVETPEGQLFDLSFSQKIGESPIPKGEFLRLITTTSQTGSEQSRFPYKFAGKEFRPPGARGWSTSKEGLDRLASSGRMASFGATLAFKRYHRDSSTSPINNLWNEIRSGGFQDEKIYVVQTATGVIERCLLMTTDPGDLVLDPTCGSGTTAYVAEQWGRRWITCDTSRVALSLTRQRLMTGRYPYYKLRPLNAKDTEHNPQGSWLNDPTGQNGTKSTFQCKTVPYVTLKSIARNASLDPIVARHDPILTEHLKVLNAALRTVSSDLRQKLAAKLIEKQNREGKKSITDADRRRWELPKTEWHEWQVPFDTDPDWPEPLQHALNAYRAAWRAKLIAVDACIAANAETEELIDKPEFVSGVIRVAGPFTVEGVRPEELSLGEEGLFDPTASDPETNDEASERVDNLQPYLAQMVQHLRTDGLTFLDNQHRKFSRLDSLFEGGSGSLIHAEGAWDDAGDQGNTVAVTFGPEHGPVTALQLEEAIRSAKQYDELVIAGFSFDAEAFAVAEEQSHPKLRVHLAQIRPDLNQAMQGLLKDTPNSQLFTVFGQPDVEVRETKDGWICSLNGTSVLNSAHDRASTDTTC